MVKKFDIDWRKSTYSGNTANCIEVGQRAFDVTLIRDSKDHSYGSLSIQPVSWQKFVDRIKNA